MKKNFKYFLKILLCMAVIFTAVPVIPAEADSNASKPAIYVTESSSSPGGYVYVSVNADNLSNLAGLQFSIEYNPDVLSLSGCNRGMLVLSSTTTVDINTSKAGLIRVLIADIKGITGDGDLLTLRFNVNSNAAAGSYPLTLLIGDAYDINFNPVALTKTHGAVTVTNRPPETPTQIDFTLSCGKISAQAGDTLSCTLNARNVYGLAGGNFVFTYDKDLLKLNTVIVTEKLKTATSAVAVKKDVPGYVKITFAEIEELDLNYGDLLAKLDFTVTANTDGKTELQFAPDSLTDYNLKPMTAPSRSQSVMLVKTASMVDYPDFILSANDDFDEETRTFTVDLSLEEGAAVAAGDFTISYDTNQIVCTDLTISGEMTSAGGILVENETMNKGTVRFSYVNPSPAKDDLKLATLTFLAADDFKGDTEITAVGRGVKALDGKYMSDLTLDYPELSVNVPTMKYNVVLGDVNLDNVVDARDLTCLARHVAEIEFLTDELALMNGDVNADKVADAADLTKLARYVAEIIDSLEPEV